MKDNIKIARELIRLAAELTVKGKEPSKIQTTKDQTSTNNQQGNAVIEAIKIINKNRTSIQSLGQKKISTLAGNVNINIGKMKLIEVLELIANISSTKKQ